MRRKTVSLGAAVVIIVLGLAACGSSGKAAGSSGGGSGSGILKVATQKPTSLVPGNSTGYFALMMASSLFTGLTSYDPKTGAPVNEVAESVKSTDQKTWNITLKSGWTFQDGTPVDAESFARGWNTTATAANAWVGSQILSRIAGYDAMNPKSGQPTATSLSGVVVKDATHLAVTLIGADSQFPYELGQPAFYPLPAMALKDLSAYALKPIGNGPYKMAEPWTGGPEIKTVRYDNYGGQKAKNGGVTFKVYTGYDVAYKDFQAGAVDITPLLPQDEASAKKLAGDRFRITPATAISYVSMPTYAPGYSDPRIRQALSMAIDRQTIINALLDPATKPVSDFVVPATNGYSAKICGDLCAYNPTKAKQLYQQAGGLPGNKLTLTVVTGTGRDPYSQAILQQWATNLGVTVELAHVASAATLSGLLSKNIQTPMTLNKPADTPSPSALLDQQFRVGGVSNYTFYNNPKFDALLDKAMATPTPDAALKVYDQAKELLAQDMPEIPLWATATPYVVDQAAKGYNRDPWNKSSYADVVVN